jgi:NADPH:quinone reductase-like Zn-dependent oxidoreductase
MHLRTDALRPAEANTVGQELYYRSKTGSTPRRRGGTRRERSFRGRYGPWAVIAGASEGLGAAIADQAAARGCDVVLVARTESELAQVAARIESAHAVRTRTLTLDLTAADAAHQLVDGVADLEVGFFVHNAAAEPRGRFLDTPDGECSSPTLASRARRSSRASATTWRPRSAGRGPRCGCQLPPSVV